MKKLIVLLLASICFGVLYGKNNSAAPVVFDFDDHKKFSDSWRVRRTAVHVPESRFSVVRADGARDGKALAIECSNSSGIALISPPGLDLKKTPVMRWRWRIIHPVRLHKGKEPDDQAGSIYICDGNSFRQFTVSYRWEILPQIGEVKLRRYSCGAVTVYGICMRNRTTPVGEWVEEERDVLADFNNFFKRDIKKRYAIGIAGNSQYSKSDTRVEIDYIEFHPRTTKRER
ncbi:MAG: DUF3047 domain-containing protein [Lentisphaeria bacterium]|nr:DUF3047 domain-containing protein [Lentisphaeria bacterium]